MKKLRLSILSLALGACLGTGATFAADDLKTEVHHAIENGHFPVIKPKNVEWSFAGPFGHYDKGQLQRGLKVYKEVCSACHSMNLVAFRNLEALGYSDDQVKAFAAEYEVDAEPNAEGEIVKRKAVPSDYFPSPFPNAEAAAYANGGAAPPDFSLIAKARGVERGFPTFIFDIFTQYQEGGVDYIYSLLTGYQTAPEGVEVPEGTYFNPYFNAAISLKMAAPLSDGQVTYDDGTPGTVEQYAKDVAAFQMWAAEPHLDERKRTGFMVLIFMLMLTGLVYLTKKSVYASKEH
ncbi:MAG: hypothetical protein RIR97_53 [Pseudomonadota bacterium]|jgi:ubiquinol-cytochrome c reductase cytochrome c1 subunit